MARHPKGTSIVTMDMMAVVCDRLADGESLTAICANSDTLPHRKTIMAYVQNNEEAWEAYSKARAIQGEHIGDQMRDIMDAPMPTDPKMAMAEVQWRRVRLDNLDKLRRQLQPFGGIRNNPNDSKATSGSITLSWDG